MLIRVFGPDVPMQRTQSVARHQPYHMKPFLGMWLGGFLFLGLLQQEKGKAQLCRYLGGQSQEEKDKEELAGVGNPIPGEEKSASAWVRPISHALAPVG